MPTPRNHPHAAMIQQWLNDDSLIVEWYNELDREWEVTDNPAWYKTKQYRFQPKTITINGHKVPEPLRVAPQYNTEYFIPCLSNLLYDCVECVDWNDTAVDNAYLRHGMVHLTKEAAEAHAKALLSFMKDKE